MVCSLERLWGWRKRRPTPAPPSETVLAFADFKDGTARPFTAWGFPTTMDFPDDPTGLAGGKVARILYSSPGGFASSDQNIEWNSPTPFRYGARIVAKADFYLPSECVSGGPQNYDNTRKLIDWFVGGEPNCRLILERTNGMLRYSVAQTEIEGRYVGEWHVDVRHGDTGIVLRDNRWFNLAVVFTTNSADGVADGKLEIFLDGISKFTLATGLSPITEKNGGTFFQSFRFGSQVTTQEGDPAMSQYRYLKNLSIAA